MDLNNTNSHILIYGAHLVALECYRELCRRVGTDKVVGFAVSDMKDNPSELAGLPVKSISEYTEYAGKCKVVIAMPQKYHEAVEEGARELGFDDFRRISLEEMSEIKGERLVSECAPKLPFKLSKSSNDPSWLDAYADGAAGNIRCKYPTLFYLDDETSVLKSSELYDAFQKELGGIQEITDSAETHDVVSDTMKIYMVFGENEIDFVEKTIFEPWVCPLQINSHNASRKIGDRHDDEVEDSLSDRNNYLAEMTGAYWVWKKGDGRKYKGLCHYRRHFVLKPGRIATACDTDTDVIFSTPRFVPGGIRGMFTAETPVKEAVVENMLKALEKCAPNDRREFEEYLDNRLYFPNNMVIAKSELYDEYCEWIFPILLRMHETDIETGYGHENDRHIAYAAELLTSYYFIKRKNEMKIKYTDYKFYEGTELT